MMNLKLTNMKFEFEKSNLILKFEIEDCEFESELDEFEKLNLKIMSLL